MRFIPKVSLHGSGEVVELSNGSHAEFTLMQGAAGLGMGPREISTVALPSGGSLVRHRRRGEAEVQLPILLGGSERKRWDLRRKLERLMRGEVEVRVTRSNGVYRSRFGYYKAGLEGSYGAGEDSPNGQKLVLEFLCPGGLWQGEEQTPNFRLSGLRKRFLSDRAEPVPTGRRNLWLGSKLSADRSAVSTNSWNTNVEQTDEGLEITIGGADNSSAVSVSYTNSGYRVPMEPGLPYSFSVPVKNTGDVEFSTKVAFYMTSGGIYPDPVVIQPGETYVFKAEGAVLADGGDLRWSLRYDAGAVVPPDGAKVTLVDGATCVQSDTAIAPVNGDSPYWGWSGEPGKSESTEYEKSSTYASPFLPIVLASSTVQGEIVINIGGDAPVYPTWVIDGPGKDLIIENDKGDSIKVLGEITDQITIVTDPLHQDITSPDNPDGELWENVPTDSVFFPLEPGEQKIKMSMVDAKPNSLVQCFYRENFLAGW